MCCLLCKYSVLILLQIPSTARVDDEKKSKYSRDDPLCEVQGIKQHVSIPDPLSKVSIVKCFQKLRATQTTHSQANRSQVIISTELPDPRRGADFRQSLPKKNSGRERFKSVGPSQVLKNPARPSCDMGNPAESAFPFTDQNQTLELQSNIAPPRPVS